MSENKTCDVELGEWESIGSDAESVSTERRDEWVDTLVETFRRTNDPTMAATSSGDRVVLCWVDDMEDGTVHLTFEDCIVTRRRHGKLLNVKFPDQKVAAEELRRKVRNTLADLRQVSQQFHKTPPADLAKWHYRLNSWIEELEDLIEG